LGGAWWSDQPQVEKRRRTAALQDAGARFGEAGVAGRQVLEMT